MIYQYRGSELSQKTDGRIDALIYRYKSINEVPWSTFAQHPDNPVRIIVQSSDKVLPLDVLYIPRDHTRLLVGLHGAEFGNEDLPKFQFVRTLTAERNESLLFLSDSTLLHSLGKVGIAWFSGNTGIDLSIAYSNLIKSLITATNIDETVLVGHSAGGMAGIKIGARIPNSRAIAVNAQCAASLYAPWTVTPLPKYVFLKEETPKDIFQKYPERFDLRVALGNRLPTSSFSWFSHVDDPWSFNEYPNFEAIRDYFELDDCGGRTNNGDLIIACKWEAPPQPHGLPGVIVPYIAVTLGEQTDFKINPCKDIDLTWCR